jgi:hypothetical protein
MLPKDWHIDFHIIKQVSFFKVTNYKDYYMVRWYGEPITLRLLRGCPIEFTKMQFTESGDLVL